MAWIYALAAWGAHVLGDRPGIANDPDEMHDLAGDPAYAATLKELAAQHDAWRKDLPCLMSHFGFWEECDLSRLPDGWTTVVLTSRKPPSADLGHQPRRHAGPAEARQRACP